MYDKNDNLISHFYSTCIVVQIQVYRLEFDTDHPWEKIIIPELNIQGLKSQCLHTICLYTNKVVLTLGNNTDDFKHVIIQ